MTLSAVISGCYLSWLPGGPPTSNHEPAHVGCRCVSLPRARLLYTPLPPSPLPTLSAHPCAIRITESRDFFRCAAFEPIRIYLIYMVKFKNMYARNNFELIIRILNYSLFLFYK